MNKLIISTALFLVVINTSIANTKELNLNNSHEIDAALKIHTSLMKVGKSVSSCYDSGNKHSACLCENKKEITIFNKLVNTTLKKYPRWLKYKSLNFKKPDGTGVIIRPIALKKQASMEAKCE